MEDLGLNCAFCGLAFTQVVKTITNCGNSICGECHQAITDQVGSSGGRKFFCFKCGIPHRCHVGGFPDNVAVQQLLWQQRSAEAHRPQETAEEEVSAVDTAHLYDQIEALNQKVNNLRNSGDDEYIDSYCDSLLAEVNDSYQAALDHLAGIKSRLFKQINEYRSDIRGKRLRSPTAKRVCRRSAQKPCTSREADVEEHQPPDQDDLDLIAQKVDDLSKQCAVVFSTGAGMSCTETIRAISSFTEFRKQLDDLEAKKKAEFYTRNLLMIKESRLFLKSDDHLGKLVYGGPKTGQTEDEPPVTTLEPMIVRDERSTTTDLTNIFNEHKFKVNQVIFLPNQRLASCSDDGFVRVWSLVNGELDYSLQNGKYGVNSLALLNEHMLASASKDSVISIWSLLTKKLVRTLEGHTNAVFCLLALAHDLLGSCSFDGSIKIWRASCKNAVQTMSNHEIVLRPVNMGILDNGNLVTCSDLGEIKIWDPHTGQCANSFESRSEGPRSLLVLPNDRVVVSFNDGTVKLVDLYYRSKPAILISCQKGRAMALACSPNGWLWTGGSIEDPSIRAWSLTSFKSVHKICTSSNGSLTTLAISKDGKKIACGSGDTLVKVWSIN